MTAPRYSTRIGAPAQSDGWPLNADAWEVQLSFLASNGFRDAEILEIIALVALNTSTNYVNEALATQIDFPRIDRLAASRKGGALLAARPPFSHSD